MHRRGFVLAVPPVEITLGILDSIICNFCGAMWIPLHTFASPTFQIVDCNFQAKFFFHTSS